MIGIAIGRWSVSKTEVSNPSQEHIALTATDPNSAPVGAEKTTQSAKVDSISQKVTSASSAGSLVRSERHIREKHMRELFGRLGEAIKKDDIDEQNRIFAEMEKLDPKHERVFEAKVTFLQDDGNWDGAYNTLKECVAIIPNSTYCLRRLSNIRSSSNEDRLRYGAECLQVSPSDPLCLVDLAIALQTKGNFEEAKIYFEQALNLHTGSVGYSRDYILVSYGETLEKLNLNQKAKAAFAEACNLRNKIACERLKR